MDGWNFLTAFSEVGFKTNMDLIKKKCSDDLQLATGRTPTVDKDQLRADCQMGLEV